MADFHTAPKSCASFAYSRARHRLLSPRPFPTNPPPPFSPTAISLLWSCASLSPSAPFYPPICASTLPKLVVERRWAARRIDLWDPCGCAAVWWARHVGRGRRHRGRGMANQWETQPGWTKLLTVPMDPQGPWAKAAILISSWFGWYGNASWPPTDFFYIFSELLIHLDEFRFSSL